MSPRPSLVLLHGITNSAQIWAEVAAELAGEFDLIVPTARGHRGGAPPDGEVSVKQLVDDVEALLDQRGIAQAHIAGNSLGGWVAIELAGRDRALSVCALSPAGFWTPGASDNTHAANAIRRSRTLARLALPLVPLAIRSARVRRHLLRVVAVHGDRLSIEAVQGIVDDLIGCIAAPELLGTAETVSRMPTAHCPITLAWSAEDRIFPPAVNGSNARRLLPNATYIELAGVGHVPMIDDPTLCANVIRNATQSN